MHVILEKTVFGLVWFVVTTIGVCQELLVKMEPNYDTIHVSFT